LLLARNSFTFEAPSVLNISDRRTLNLGYENYYVGCPATSFQVFAKSAISRVAALDPEKYDGGDSGSTAGSAQGIY
jgi:hypothetical protein